METKKPRIISKAKRHKFYKQALTEYVEYYTILTLGLCQILTKVTGINCYNNMQRFPEIYKHRPESIGKNDYWWSLNSSQKRIEVLEEAIELTKPKRRVKI